MAGEFETARRKWVALIGGLPETMLADDHIARRLRLEIPGHYAEHALPPNHSTQTIQ